MRPEDLLSLLGILAVMAGILAGAYYFTRWAGRGLGTLPGMGSQNLRVLDRISLGRDQSMLVVRANKRYFLVGAAPSGDSSASRLTPEEGAAWEHPAPTEGGVRPGPGEGFQQLFQKISQKKKD